MKETNRDPVRSESFNQRGIELADRGWLDQATREFSRAIELDPSSPFPRINRASVYMEQGAYLEAMEDLLTSIRLAPEEASAHYHLGVLLAHHGTELATQELKLTLEMEPDQVDSLLHLGMIYADQGEFREAEGAFQRALDLDPLDPFVHREMGILLMEKGNIHRSIAHLKTACDQQPEDKEIIVDLATAYIQAGFYNKAQQLLQQVLAKDPDHLQANYHMAALFADWGKNDQALQHLKRGMSIECSRVQEWLEEDHMFDKLREDKRFAELLVSRRSK